MPGMTLPQEKRVLVTTSQTVTIPDWVRRVYLFGCGGGNGGNGGGGSAAANNSGTGGKGATPKTIVLDVSTLSSPKQLAITIGAGGVGGAGGGFVGDGSPGGTGGDTIVRNNGVAIFVWGAPDAQGGNDNAGGLSGSYTLSTTDHRNPLTGTSIRSGKKNTAGEASGYGTGGPIGAITAGSARGGGGGASIGNGGTGGTSGWANGNPPGAGQVGTGYGSGGGGGGGAEGPNSDSTPGAAGGNGKDGVVILFYDDPTQTTQGDF